MATNFIQPGENLTVTADADVSAGELVVLGSIVGVALNDALSGADVTIKTSGAFTLTKTSALAIAIGDIVYTDATAGDVNKTASGNICVGVALSTAANPSATVDVLLGNYTVPTA